MKLTINEWHTLSLTGVAHFGCHLAMLIFPTAAIALALEEGLALETVLGWSFAGYFIFGLGAFPAGLITDRLRARWVVRTGVLGIGPALMLVALSDPGPSLVIALTMVGAFASVYHPAGMSLISRNFRQRGKALGINGICGNIGIAGAPVLTEWLSNSWGWRGAYAAIGGLLLVMGLLVAFYRIEEPKPGEALRDERHHVPSERLKLFLILMVAMTLAGLAYRASTVAQPAYFAERVDFIGYGAATSIVYIIATFGQYLSGHLADRYDLRILYIIFHGLGFPFAIAMVALSGAPLMVCAAIFVFFSVGMQPIENSLVARFTPDRWRSTGYGLKFTVTFAIGALSVWGVKAIIAHSSLSMVFPAIGGIGFLIFLTACVLFWQTRGRPVLNHPTANLR